MITNLICVATFGLIEFSKICIEYIQKTVTSEYDLLVIVGKPGDNETIKYLEYNNIKYISHDKNYGFAVALNDAMDYCWKDNNYTNFIIVGNDVFCYPNAIDNLIDLADKSSYDIISATEYSIKDFVVDFPETREIIEGDDYIIKDLSNRFWDKFTDYNKPFMVSDLGMKDIQNLALYKRSLFDTVGYIDVNFFPAYYQDNDLARRCHLSGLKGCTLGNSIYFHCWSRTIKQGSGGSNNRFFENNREYYMTKWGGDKDQEKYVIPFNNKRYYLENKIYLEPTLKIKSRQNEKEIVRYWLKRL